MRLCSVIITVLLTVSVGYYLYIPLPDAIQEPWKLMLLDAGFRTTMHLASLMERLGLDNYGASLRKWTEMSEDMTELWVGDERGGGGGGGGGVTPGVKVSDLAFAGVPVRVYEPPAGGEGHLRRGVLYIHGGGWVLGSAEKGSYDFITRMMSDELNAVVVSVQYRLYPEVEFPVPVLECLAVAKHFLSRDVLVKYSIDPERVAVSGDSAGGNMAAAVAQEIANDDSMSVKFSVQALVYPVLQALDFNTPSYLENKNYPILYRKLMVKLWQQYLGIDQTLLPQLLVNNHSAAVSPELMARVNWTVLLDPKYKKNHKQIRGSKGLQWVEKVPGLVDVRAAPLLGSPGVLAKCPRAYILTCQYDVLRDDGLMYARRLRDAGVAVTHIHLEDGFHGCFSFVWWPLQFDVGVRARQSYLRWLQDNL